MNKRELAKLKKWTDTLTDEELKKEYYDVVAYRCATALYEAGYRKVEKGE